MHYTAAANSFAHKYIDDTGNVPAQMDVPKNAHTQVYILSADENLSSLLLTCLSKLKTVHICGIYDDVEPLSRMRATDDAAILFIDAALFTTDIALQIKARIPGSLIILLGSERLQMQEDLHEHVFSYLETPIVFGDVFFVVNQALLYYRVSPNTMQHKKDFVLIKSEYRLVKVDLSDILFIAGMKDYIKIWIKNRTAPLTTLQNLKEFEKKLSPQDFIRVHKSYIVALQHIDCIARNEIMIGTYSIPVGDAFRNGLNGFIEEHS